MAEPAKPGERKTRAIEITRAGVQFWVIIGTLVVAASGAWALHGYRLSELERRHVMQATKAEAMGDTVQEIKTQQAVMASEQKGIAKGVDEIKQAVQAMRGPK